MNFYRTILYFDLALKPLPHFHCIKETKKGISHFLLIYVSNFTYNWFKTK